MLDVIDISKQYQGKPLLKGITFSVGAGETVCILGPSGGGKSTLLRIIAGLETAEKGSIHWKGAALGSKPPHLRNFGLMFQDYALFPHRSVKENIAFGLRMKKAATADIDEKVKILLEKVNLGSFGERRVTDLSGGEQQRVALARTLAPDPELLMLDEPLGALDRSLAEQLAAELRQILKSTGTPALYVTHDQQEAFTVAERILLIHDGKIVQDDTPRKLYQQPASVWVARFLGLTNLLEGTLVSTDPLQVKTSLGTFQVNTASLKPKLDRPVHILLRSEQVQLEPAETHPNHIHVNLEDAIFQGAFCRVDVRTRHGQRMRFFLPPNTELEKTLDLYFSPGAITCIPENE